MTVPEAHKLPQASQIALLQLFFLELQDAVKYILLVPDHTDLDTRVILENVQNYISQRKITLDCVAFEECKQAVGKSSNSFLITIKMLTRDAISVMHVPTANL